MSRIVTKTIIATAIVILAASILRLWFEKAQKISLGSQHASLFSPPQEPLPAIFQPEEIKTENQSDQNDGLWEGPILYHEGKSEPIFLILIEKELQELSLYRYDGRYHKEKVYPCVTGKQSGDKESENDDKTPEGIYFNNKTYRDNKVTIFGDRAFGLNFPDVFDDFEGNEGSGIFLHGSNRDITPYSTNGCLVMANDDLADLDKRVPFKTTPIIIGNRLPYRFSAHDTNLIQVVPFIKKTMLPKTHAKNNAAYPRFTMFGYQDQVVALGIVQIDSPEVLSGLSRVYLANPGKNLLVLLKREWNEEQRLTAGLKKIESDSVVTEKIQIESLIELWRSAWEGKNLNEYISHYHPQFSNKGRNLLEWKRYKQNLNSTYKKISITISNLTVKIDREKALAYFQQHYETESYDARGYKLMEFRKKDNAWKIFRENSFTEKPKDWPD